MTHEHESRSHRSSAVVWPNEPDSDRGSFLNFMEESGANAVLTDAFRALYDCPEKPDAPLQWLRTYFRNRAPSRKDEIKEMKDSLKRELLELQSSIFAMQEEAERKEELIKVLQGAKGEANYEPTSPLPERDEYFAEGNENLRSDTRWRLQPDPFARASCSAEEVLAAKEQESVRPPDSSSMKTDSIMPPEDDFEDEHTLTFLTTADEEEDDEEEVESATSREETEDEEDNQDVNYKDEAWLKAYNVYKKTSHLPASDLNNPTTIPDPALGSSSNIHLIAGNLKSKTSSKVHLQENAPHLDAFPADYWAPGFNLLIESHQSSDSDSDSAMLDHDNDELGRTKSELYYKASRGNSRYVLRPQRDQVIYENEWDLWSSLERARGRVSGSYSSALKNNNHRPKSSKVVHGPEFKSSQQANEISEDEDEEPLPSTNSVQLGSSMKNLFDVIGGKSMHDPQ